MVYEDPEPMGARMQEWSIVSLLTWFVCIVVVILPFFRVAVSSTESQGSRHCHPLLECMPNGQPLKICKTVHFCMLAL